MEAALLWNLLNLIGIGLSIYAVWTATSAKRSSREVAAAVVSRSNSREDNERLRMLIATLATAKEATIRRRRGASQSMLAGHDLQRDLQGLQTAQDALLTQLPLDFARDLRADTQEAANEIQTALENIQNVCANRDGWKDAYSTLQILIPKLEKEERRQRNEEILGHVKI